jgi:hypothetical protein
MRTMAEGGAVDSDTHASSIQPTLKGLHETVHDIWCSS